MDTVCVISHMYMQIFVENARMGEGSFAIECTKRMNWILCPNGVVYSIRNQPSDLTHGRLIRWSGDPCGLKDGGKWTDLTD